MKRSQHTTSITDRLAALGELVRLRMLRVLEREELSVGEVAKVVQLPQSTVSRHLKVLADGEWVAKRTEGTATYYRVVLDDLPKDSRALWLAVREQLGATSELSEDLRRVAAVLAERREDSQAFFGRVAGQWDEVRAELFGSRFTMAGMLALLPREWTVIDLGCGTGNAAELLSPLVKRVIAVDRSQPMLSAAKKRLSDCANVEFLLGDMTSLPVEASSADAAVCFLVMHHVEDPGAAFKEIARVLRPGGQVLVVDMVEHDRDSYRHTMGHKWLGFSRSAIEAHAKHGDFQKMRYVTLPGDTDARGPGLFAMTAFKD